MKKSLLLSLRLRIVGLEPTRSHPRKILSLVRLPFRHIRIFVTQGNKDMIMYFEMNVKKILYKNRKQAYNKDGKREQAERRKDTDENSFYRAGQSPVQTYHFKLFYI